MSAMLKPGKGFLLVPKIRSLIRNGNFEVLLGKFENSAWNALKSVNEILLGNHETTNYSEIVN